MKKLLHILPVFAALLGVFPSCLKEEGVPYPTAEKRAVEHEGEEVTVYFGVQMPEPVTRAMGENPEIHSLHVAVFGSSGYLKEYKLAEPVNDTYVNTEGEPYKQGYKVNVSITSSKVRVHFIANGPATLDFDYEANVMANLASMGGDDAYWYRLILNNGFYADTDHPGYYDTPPELVIDPDFDLDTDGVTHKMALIPMIRNFAKITVEAAPVAESNFTVSSYAVVNAPDRGLIAAYDSNTGTFVENYHTYPDLDAMSAVYPGNMPASAIIDTSHPSEEDFTNLTNGVVAAGGSIYMYERPVPVSNATILIVKGIYRDPDTLEEFPGYYKIDLMDGGEYLPILRNFRYLITIQKVNRKGKSTVTGAINGAGSADISADISTASQTNISDGVSAISVSYTENTLPIGGTYTLGVAFIPDVVNAPNTEDNTKITYQLLDPEDPGRPVIADISDISYNSSTGTLSYTTTEVDPVHTKIQKIRVIGTSATSMLYRDVTIRLMPKQTMTVSCIPEIEAAAGTPQVVTIAIPKDLPQSIFPLQFFVEVEAKSLTPNASDLPVEPGQTIITGQSGNSFQFVKTLSYQDYIAGYQGSNSVFTCEFKSIIPVSDSDIYVANKFFNTGSTSFVTFEMRYFTNLAFSRSNAVNEDDPVNFYFLMDEAHDDANKLIPETVDVWLTGLYPHENETRLERVSGNRYVFTVPEGYAGTGTQTLQLRSTGETAHYAVSLSAEHYEDNALTNAMKEFTGAGFTSAPLYGNGWPASFSFTIPDDYEIPAGGINIELGMTNLVPNDGNIIESEGKYYYRATSTGTKTISFKTSGNRTAEVALTLSHGDFETASDVSGRQYMTIAAGRITNSVPGATRPFRTNRNTVYVFTDKSGSSQVSSYTTNTSNSGTSVTNYSAANFASNVVDATQSLYLRMTSVYNENTYWATTTAETLYNNGGTSTVTFSTGAPGTRQVTINTTNANYSTSNRTYTYDGVTVTFSSLTSVSNGYLTIPNNATATISVPAGYHISTMEFSYYSGWTTTYDPGSVSASTGTYSGGTWTSANSTTQSTVLTFTRSTGWQAHDIRLESIVVTVVED